MLLANPEAGGWLPMIFIARIVSGLLAKKRLHLSGVGLARCRVGLRSNQSLIWRPVAPLPVLWRQWT